MAVNGVDRRAQQILFARHTLAENLVDDAVMTRVLSQRLGSFLAPVPRTCLLPLANRLNLCRLHEPP